MAHPLPLPELDHPPLRSLTGMKPGDHLCCIYRTDEEHRAVITQFIRCGFEQNDKILSIGDERTADQIFGYLKDAGLDPEPYIQSGQLEIQTVLDSSMEGGAFEPGAMIRLLSELTESALKDGYSSLRVTWEMTWALHDLPGTDWLIEYENLLNTYLPEKQCLVICLYDRRSVPSDILLDILQTHPYAVIGSEVYKNVFYIPPEDFSRRDRSSVLLDHWIENLRIYHLLRRALEHERQATETYLDSAGVMMVVLDRDGTIRLANQKTAEVLGIPAAELIGENWFTTAIPDRIRNEVRDVHSMIIRGKVSAVEFFDNPVITSFGVERIIAWHNVLLRDEDGAIEGTLSSGEDVTALRHAENEAARQHDAILESEHRLSDIIDFLPDATFAIDEKGVVIAWNHAIEEMTGVPAEEMIGKGEYAYAVPFYGKRQPMLIDLVFKDDNGLRSRYELLNEMPGAIEAETKYARPKGEDRILWGRVSPLHDSKGSNVGAIETIRDITERKHAEVALQVSESLQHFILAAVPDILIRSDADGRYLDILTPDDERFILPKADLIGKTIAEVTSEEIGSRLTEAIRMALSSKAMQTVEYTFPVPAGNHHFEARIVPYSKDEVIALIRDVTDKKKAEDALHERIKELACLYRISATIEHLSLSEEEVLQKIADLIPEGFRYPGLTGARITIDSADYSGKGYQMTPWSVSRDIIGHQKAIGAITVCFRDEYVISAEESVLLRNCAEQIGRYIERIRSVALLQTKNEELAAAEEELRGQLDELVATQQLLRESEEYIRMVLDHLPIGVAVNSVDSGVNFEYFNEKFFQIYRTTADALSHPDAFWDVVYEDPTFRRELRERVFADVTSGDPTRMHWEDIPITRKGEETTYISAADIPVPGKDLVISTVWDVTNRVEAQDRVRLHLIRVQHLLNLHRMTDATEQELFNFTLNAALAMVESHYAFIGMMSGDESEMILHVWSQDTMEDCTVIDKPMHFPIASAGIWGECVRNRKPVVFNDYAASHPAKHGYPKGHVEITRYLGVPIFDGNRIVAVLSVANKETEYRDDDIDALMTLGNSIWGLIHRRRFDAVLRESEEKYRLLVENQQDLVIKTDPNGRFLYANPAYCRLFDKTEEELIGTSYMPLVHPDDRAVVEAAVALLVKPPYECSYEERAETSLGWRWLEWTARAWHDDDGEINAFVGTGRDITDRKLAEEKLRQFEWIVDKELPSDAAALYGLSPAYGDLTNYNTSRIILDGVGMEHLALMAADVMVLLDTSLAVYERNGDYAYGIFQSSWCRFLDEAAFRLCGMKDAGDALSSGRWLCHENCWNESAKTAMESKEPTDIGCVGGIRLYAVPISVGGEVIGVVNIGYGNPPKDDATLRQLARKYQVSPDKLHEMADAYKPRPDFIIELGKRRCQYMAEMIGGIIERNRAEETLKRSEERYRSVSTLISDIAYSCLKTDDEDYRIDWMVGAIERISGYEIDEVIAEGCWGFLVHPDDMRIFEDSILSLPAGSSSECELRIIRKDGSIGWLSAITRCLQYENGELRIYGGCRDITEEKNDEAIRKKASAQIEENMYKFSILNDEIRNPLAVIMALADLEGGKYAEQIMDQVKTIDRIITLLDQGVLESESTRAFMLKYDQLSSDHRGE